MNGHPSPDERRDDNASDAAGWHPALADASVDSPDERGDDNASDAADWHPALADISVDARRHGSRDTRPEARADNARLASSSGRADPRRAVGADDCAALMPLPAVPMSPHLVPELPAGPEWGFQLKWDGKRTLARLDGDGGVELFTKKLEPSGATFPEVVALLTELRIGPCLLDGEIVYFDGRRPIFQKGRRNDLIYVLFDLLYDNGRDIRALPLRERFGHLQELLSERQPRLFVTDLFADGEALWRWAMEREWEGVVAKRLDSPYAIGKNHDDWFKKRKAIRFTADAVGLKLTNGRVSSLVLRYEGRYIGHVSSGLDEPQRDTLLRFAREHAGPCPFPPAALTADMRRAHVLWLRAPFKCAVAGLEFTASGQLRQPRLLGFGATAE